MWVFPAFCSRVGESPHFRFRASTWKTSQLTAHAQRARHFFNRLLSSFDVRRRARRRARRRLCSSSSSSHFTLRDDRPRPCSSLGRLFRTLPSCRFPTILHPLHRLWQRHSAFQKSSLGFGRVARRLHSGFGCRLGFRAPGVPKASSPVLSPRSSSIV